jgi:C4-dicarboxylate transporter DctQ subunit
MNMPQASTRATVLPALNGAANVPETSVRQSRRLLESTGDYISRVANILAAVSLLVITAVNVANVVARYVFTSPFAWAEELMIYLMILIVFTGCVTATWHQIHIRIDLLTEHLKPRVRAVTNAVVTAIGVVALALIIKASLATIERLYRFEQLSLALEAPLWIPQSFVSIGLAIVAVLMVVRLVVPRRDDRTPESGK